MSFYLSINSEDGIISIKLKPDCYYIFIIVTMASSHIKAQRYAEYSFVTYTNLCTYNMHTILSFKLALTIFKIFLCCLFNCKNTELTLKINLRSRFIFNDPNTYKITWLSQRLSMIRSNLYRRPWNFITTNCTIIKLFCKLTLIK